MLMVVRSLNRITPGSIVGRPAEHLAQFRALERTMRDAALSAPIRLRNGNRSAKP